MRTLDGKVALVAGATREQMLDNYGVKEANWRDAIAKQPHFARSTRSHDVGGRGVGAEVTYGMVQRTRDSVFQAREWCTG